VPQLPISNHWPIQLLQIALLSCCTVVAVLAPAFARYIHRRQHIQFTRRSMVLSTLAIECSTIGVGANAISPGLSDDLTRVILITGGYSLLIAGQGVLALAFARSRQELPQPPGNDFDHPA
jgi:hypothetical protein